MSTKKERKSNSRNKIFLLGGAMAVTLIAVIILIVIAINGKEEPVVSGQPYDYEASGNLKLGDYKGINISVDVTDTDVQDEIELILEETELYTQEQGKPVEGDIVCISYTASVDGNELEDYSGENEYITVGDEDIEAEFDSTVLTMNTGETKNVDIEYPESYGDELVDGKTVSYAINLHYIAGDPLVQELTDEFVESYTDGEVTSTDDFPAYIKETLYQDNVDCLADSAWEIVLENVKVDKYSKGEVKVAEEETKKSYEEFAELMGQSVYDAFGMTDEDIEDVAKELALERMIAKTIAAKENLVMDDAKYTEVLREYLQYDDENEDLATMNLEELEKYYLEVYQEEPKELMFTEFVKAFIVDNAVVTGLK